MVTTGNIGSGVHRQIVNGNTKYYTDLTQEELDKYLNELSKMGKYKNNKKKQAPSTKPSEALINQVVDLYKPNKFEKFFGKYFSSYTTDNRVYNATITSLVVLSAFGIITRFLGFNEIAVGEAIIFLITGGVTLGGTIYANIKDKQRVSDLMNILKMSKDEIITLCKKYYI